MDPSTPTSQPLRRRRVVAVDPGKPQTYSGLLASFGASQSPMSAKRMAKENHGLRQKATVSYAESDNSSEQPSPHSSFADSPSSATSNQPNDRLSEESEDELSSGDVIHVAPRPSMATRELPSRSTRAQVSYASPKRVIKKRKTARNKSKRLLTSDASDVARPIEKATTARALVRQEIADHTKPKRDAFLLAHAEYFLPLLPGGNNYIMKLQRTRSEHNRDESNYGECHHDDDNEVEFVPHKMIATQPAGIKAVMKPYQIEGLSYLVHMYNNGMSAILGDEMGLGKTLQTLSLFQHLTETQAAAVGEARPFLVVCPLSVLSSWINETAKWTGFKVIRFHGPKSERDRLKQETLGLIDRYGQHTSKGSSKAHKASKTKSGATRIELDGDDERVNAAERPVDIVVTTYETFVSEQSWFKRAFVWRYVVLDEGHKVKNEKSDIASALQSLKAEHRLLLTGTPLQNNLQELWALLHWLYPEVFPLETSIRFKQAFDLTKGSASTSFMDDARRLLELVMLRRMKHSPGVNLGLPPKVEILMFVPLTPMQRFWYQRLLTKADNGLLEEVFKGAMTKETQALKHEEDDDAKEFSMLQHAADAAENLENGEADVWAESKRIMAEAMENDMAAPKGRDWTKLMNLIMQLRKVCSHPYLISNAVPDPYFLGDHIIKASGKFIVLDKLVEQLVLQQRKKVIIFSGFTNTLNLCEDLLVLKGANSQDAPFRYLRLDGSTARAKRNLGIRMFNDMTSDFHVMLVSTRAGGLGINLTSATEVVFMDEDWNPQITLQAEARAHRIGQKNKVTIYKLCTQGTVEEQMMGRIRKKLYLSAKITESMRNMHSATADQDSKKRKRGPVKSEMEQDAPQLGTSELKTLLRRGAQTLSAPEVDVTEMLTWDWETTLEKCKDKPIDAHVSDPTGKVEKDEVDEKAWLNSIEKVETAVFEGKVHQRQLEKAAKSNVELVRANRRLGKNTTVMVDGFAISKESMGCADWEAVPTFAGKDPRLADVKREKKAPIVNQAHCQVCWTDEGTVSCCSGCPRSYHLKCLPPDMKPRAKASFGSFYCTQHQCCVCEKKTGDVGGLIYRCRWCEKGFCEDCLNWDDPNKPRPRLVGENIPELEMLGYETKGGWYMDCPHCIQRWETDEEDAKRFQAEKKLIDKAYRKHVLAIEKAEAVAGPEMSEGTATPATVSEAMTPVDVDLPVPKKAKLGLLGQATRLINS